MDGSVPRREEKSVLINFEESQYCTAYVIAWKGVWCCEPRVVSAVLFFTYFRVSAHQVAYCTAVNLFPKLLKVGINLLGRVSYCSGDQLRFL